MKKTTKKTKLPPDADAPLAANASVGDEFDRPTPEQLEAAQEFFATPLLWFLEQSQSAEEFYRRLSELIVDANKLTDDECKWLANLVQKPWKPKRGAGTKQERYFEIFYDYIFPSLRTDLPDAPSLRRTDAIPLIMERYKLTVDAAGKSYDIAKKCNGQSPPPKSARER